LKNANAISYVVVDLKKELTFAKVLTDLGHKNSCLFVDGAVCSDVDVLQQKVL
jgi:hypothetical protein